MLLNDLSFATSDTFQNLSPKSKIGEPDVPFLRDLAFVMVSAVIGKYLSLAISEPTAKRDAARIVEEISHKIPPGMLTLAREQGVILRGFALNELAYNDSRDRILLPVYREDLNGNTVRAFTYIYSLDPKDHDIWMPIGKGGKVYIRCESAPGYGAPASKATGHPPSASSVIDIGTRKISVRSCHATAEIDDMSRAIIYGRYSRLRLGIIDDLRHAASELARNIRNSLPGYDLSSWIITYPPSIAPLNSAASLAALISDELGIPVVKMRKSHKAAKKYYLESKSGEKEALIKGSISADRDAVSGKNVILIDDSIATGIVIKNTALALADKGAGDIKAFTYLKLPSSPTNIESEIDSVFLKERGMVEGLSYVLRSLDNPIQQTLLHFVLDLDSEGLRRLLASIGSIRSRELLEAVKIYSGISETRGASAFMGEDDNGNASPAQKPEGQDDPLRFAVKLLAKDTGRLENQPGGIEGAIDIARLSCDRGGPLSKFISEAIADFKGMMPEIELFDSPETLFSHLKISEASNDPKDREFVRHIRSRLAAAPTGKVYLIRTFQHHHEYMSIALPESAEERSSLNEVFYLDRNQIARGFAIINKYTAELRMGIDDEDLRHAGHMQVFFSMRQHLVSKLYDPAMMLIPHTQASMDWNTYFFYIRKGYLPIGMREKGLVIREFIDPWLRDRNFRLELPDKAIGVMARHSGGDLILFTRDPRLPRIGNHGETPYGAAAEMSEVREAEGVPSGTVPKGTPLKKPAIRVAILIAFTAAGIVISRHIPEWLALLAVLAADPIYSLYCTLRDYAAFLCRTLSLLVLKIFLRLYIPDRDKSPVGCVIWDFAGTLHGMDDYAQASRKLSELYRIDPDKVRRLFEERKPKYGKSGNIIYLYETGQLGKGAVSAEDEFLAGINGWIAENRTNNRPLLSRQEWEEIFCTVFRSDISASLLLAEELKRKGYLQRVLTVSNAIHFYNYILRTAVFSEGLIDPDDVHSSHITGLPKPQKAAFMQVADKAGVPYGRCLVLDDAPENYRGALDAGMMSVLVNQDRPIRSVLSAARMIRARNGEASFPLWRVIFPKTNNFALAVCAHRAWNWIWDRAGYDDMWASMGIRKSYGSPSQCLGAIIAYLEGQRWNIPDIRDSEFQAERLIGLGLRKTKNRVNLSIDVVKKELSRLEQTGVLIKPHGKKILVYRLTDNIRAIPRFETMIGFLRDLQKMMEAMEIEGDLPDDARESVALYIKRYFERTAGSTHPPGTSAYMSEGDDEENFDGPKQLSGILGVSVKDIGESGAISLFPVQKIKKLLSYDGPFRIVKSGPEYVIPSQPGKNHFGLTDRMNSGVFNFTLRFPDKERELMYLNISHDPSVRSAYLFMWIEPRSLRGHGIGKLWFEQIMLPYFRSLGVENLFVCWTCADVRRERSPQGFWEKMGFKVVRDPPEGYFQGVAYYTGKRKIDPAVPVNDGSYKTVNPEEIIGTKSDLEIPVEFRIASELTREEQDRVIRAAMKSGMWPVDNLANRFENHEPDAMVAYIGDRPVGAYSFIWAGQDLKADEILSNGIWVDDGARRSGIGTKLRNRLYEYLKSQGFRKFSIVSVKDTEGAQRFQLALSASEGVTINFSDDGKKVSSVIIDLQKFRYRPMPGNSAASKAGAAAEMSEGDEPEGVPSGSAPEIATQVDFVQKVAGITERLKERKDERVVIIADSEETALDIAILANKTPGVRAAWCFNAEQVKLTRQHNDANILIVLNGNPQTDEFIKIWESTRFDGGRHQDRLDLIKRFEQEASNRHTKGKPETAAGAERKIAIGCDHGALELKEAVKAALVKLGWEVIDKGTNSPSSCNYPEFGAAVARSVDSGECPYGIVMCTTGIGISITANRFPNVKCALCHTAGQAKAAHRHCNANILALGAKSTSAKDTEGIIAKLTAFLPSAPAISPETERLQALMLKDTVKLIEDADTESRINVALGTSWIAAYDRSEIERYNDLNRLITAVGSMFGRHKINFIAQRHDESDADFAGRVAALEGGRTIIMAGLDTIAGDDSPFAGFRDREGVFLAGVDAKETGLDRNCYIQIVEMLKMALQIGLKDIIGQDSRSDSISAERYGRFTNVFRFLPRPRRFDESDYEKLRLIYEAQLFA